MKGYFSQSMYDELMKDVSFKKIQQYVFQKNQTSYEHKKTIPNDHTKLFHKSSWDRTKWYTMNYDLWSSLGKMENVPIDVPKVGTSYIDTETTTEITSENSIQEEKNQNSEDSDVITDAMTQAYQLWNQKVGCKTKPNPERLQRLKTLFKLKCDNNFEQWKTFCESISTSSFLTRKNTQGWRITLVWVLNPENTQKVLEGYYKTPEEIMADPQKNTSEDINARIQVFFEKCQQDQVKSFFFSLKTLLSAQKFISWFEEVSYAQNLENKLVLLFSSAFHTEYIRNHFQAEIHQAAKISRFQEVMVSAHHSSRQQLSQNNKEPSCTKPSSLPQKGEIS